MSNKSDGNKFEIVVSKYLADKGFWVHRLAANSYGQPADIIAVKNGNAYLIDAKNCNTKRGFTLSRIEENQECSMTLWADRGNGVGWFAIGLDDGIYMFALNSLLSFRDKVKAISPGIISEFGIPIEEWCKWR